MKHWELEVGQFVRGGAAFGARRDLPLRVLSTTALGPHGPLVTVRDTRGVTFAIDAQDLEPEIIVRDLLVQVRQLLTGIAADEVPDLGARCRELAALCDAAVRGCL